MANYTLKYQCSFDPLLEVSDGYTLQILQKNYTGSVTSVKGGSTPVLHDWQTDDPKAPIKGSSLSISLINDGSLPLNSFLSIDADEFKVIFKYGSQTLFEGFLVQDDCQEELVDYTHEIKLSANDNLGLLKDLTLDKADTAFTYTLIGSESFSSTAPHSLIVPNTVGIQLQPGDKIKIVGSAADGTYTVSLVEDDGATFAVTVVEPIPTQTTITEPIYIGKLSLLDKKPLSDIIGMCLRLTDLQLSTYVWGQINETSQDQTKCFLDQTLIDPGTFLKDAENYLDCYTILTYILSAFNFTLFQSMGAWQIVRWDELRYYVNEVPAYVYNSDMTLTGYSLMQAPFDAGFGKPTYAENGLLQRAVRPFQYVKETFNFKQPPQLLRNFDLKTLGTLLREYDVNVWLWGGNTYFSYDEAKKHTGSPAEIVATYLKYREYTALWWYQNDVIAGNVNYFIRVTTDSLDNEIERRLVIKNSETYDYVKSYQVEAQAGDVFKYSFTARTSKYPQREPLYMSVLVQLVSADDVKMIRWNNSTTPFGYFTTVKVPEWDAQVTTGDSLLASYIFQIPNGKPDTEFTIEIDMTYSPIPNDGLLYFNLSSEIYYQDGTPISPPKLSHYDEITYKDIRLEYTPLINATTKIIGQTHTNDQNGNPKNNSDVEIFMDSSPRNSIVGTLFLNEKDGLLQKRTSKWKHPYLPLQAAENLGQLVTFEELFWRRKPRTIIEGTMHGLLTQNTVPYGCNVYVTIDPLAGTEEVTFSWTSTPPGTTGTIISYWNGQWNDSTGSATSPRTLTIPAGLYAFRIFFLGTDKSYYFNGLPTHLSMLSVLRYSQFSGFNFVAGKLTIDYKNNKFTGTWWEIWDDGEKDSDLNDTYNFNYLYSPI